MGSTTKSWYWLPGRLLMTVLGYLLRRTRSFPNSKSKPATGHTKTYSRAVFHLPVKRKHIPPDSRAKPLPPLRNPEPRNRLTRTM